MIDVHKNIETAALAIIAKHYKEYIIHLCYVICNLHMANENLNYELQTGFFLSHNNFMFFVQDAG